MVHQEYSALHFHEFWHEHIHQDPVYDLIFASISKNQIAFLGTVKTHYAAKGSNPCMGSTQPVCASQSIQLVLSELACFDFGRLSANGRCVLN